VFSAIIESARRRNSDWTTLLNLTFNLAGDWKTNRRSENARLPANERSLARNVQRDAAVIDRARSLKDNPAFSRRHNCALWSWIQDNVSIIYLPIDRARGHNGFETGNELARWYKSLGKYWSLDVFSRLINLITILIIRSLLFIFQITSRDIIIKYFSAMWTFIKTCLNYFCISIPFHIQSFSLLFHSPLLSCSLFNSFYLNSNLYVNAFRYQWMRGRQRRMRRGVREHGRKFLLRLRGGWESRVIRWEVLHRYVPLLDKSLSAPRSFRTVRIVARWSSAEHGRKHGFGFPSCVTSVDDPSSSVAEINTPLAISSS